MYKFILLLIVSALLFSCGQDKKVEENNKAILVLLDVTGSTNNAKTINSYLDNYKRISEKMSGGDALIVAMINEKSLSENNLPVNYRFATYTKNTDNPMYEKGLRQLYDKQIQHTKDSLLNVVTELLHSNIDAPSTDILGALLFARKIFSYYPQHGKILVLMSDMLQSDTRYNFEKNIPDKNQTKRILNEIEKNNLIADLNEVKIYASGANADNVKEFSKLQYFWTEYFKAAKADFTEDRFCSTLIDFNE